MTLQTNVGARLALAQPACHSPGLLLPLARPKCKARMPIIDQSVATTRLILARPA
jgi:hypothetical protein